MMKDVNKKFVILLFCYFVLALSVPMAARAQLNITGSEGTTSENAFLQILTVPFYFLAGAGYSMPQSGENLVMPIAAIILTLFSFLALIFFGIMVYGGILWIGAGGNEERVNKARKIFQDSLFGLLIVLASYTISYFIIYLIAQATGGTTGGGTLSEWVSAWWKSITT